MKLVVRRDQAEQKGMFGGSKGVLFALYYRLELNDAERALVAKYKLEPHPLTFHETSGAPAATVGEAVKGVTQEHGSVTTLVNNEEVIKSGCRDFKALLAIATTFGGEETIEI